MLDIYCIETDTSISDYSEIKVMSTKKPSNKSARESRIEKRKFAIKAQEEEITKMSESKADDNESIDGSVPYPNEEAGLDDEDDEIVGDDEVNALKDEDMKVKDVETKLLEAQDMLVWQAEYIRLADEKAAKQKSHLRLLTMNAKVDVKERGRLKNLVQQLKKNTLHSNLQGDVSIATKIKGKAIPKRKSKDSLITLLKKAKKSGFVVKRSHIAIAGITDISSQQSREKMNDLRETIETYISNNVISNLQEPYENTNIMNNSNVSHVEQIQAKKDNNKNKKRKYNTEEEESDDEDEGEHDDFTAFMAEKKRDKFLRKSIIEKNNESDSS